MEQKLNILYEDNHIIVLIKPHNILTQSDITGEIDMLNLVKNYIKEKYNKPGEAFVGIVHRLDRPTGGVMVFARTSKAAARLSKQIQDRTFKKHYFAVVHGDVRQKEGLLENYLKKDPKTNLVKIAPRSEQGAKQAILYYKQLQYVDNLSLLDVEIKTGRSHQIRVQLSNMKNPIYGDNKYGSNISEPTTNLALWAYSLDFVHPTTKVAMKFRCLPNQEEQPWNKFYLEKFIWKIEVK